MPSSHSPAKLTRPPAPTPRIVELVVVRGRDLGLSFLLEGTEMVLGRSSGVELRIDDPDVSRRHARLCRTGPIWRVEDLGSRNGTFVNGERVEGTRALRLGDRLRLGTQLELAVAEDEPARGELLQRQRLMAVGRLSLGIAHDFNNMLATLAASIDYLRQAGPGDPQGQADCLFDMQVAVERATELASRLLHAGKGSSGRLRTVDGSQLLAEAAMLLRRSIPRHIRIETDVAPRIHLRGDSVALHQVVMNLLMNARDALPPSGGVIVLAARTDGSEVHVEVRDNGSGMSPETSARIFEPFFTTKQDGVGFGLGLATTKAIVERHGGTIAVESTPGLGTTFRLTFSASAPERMERIATATSFTPRTRGGLRVLLVDDESTLRRALGRVLRRGKVEVVEAEDGFSAIERALDASAPPDVILMDVDMPQLDGIEACRRLRELGSKTPVILLSGHHKQHLVDLARDAGATGVLQKPVRSEELFQAIAEVRGADEGSSDTREVTLPVGLG